MTKLIDSEELISFINKKKEGLPVEQKLQLNMVIDYIHSHSFPSVTEINSEDIHYSREFMLKDIIQHEISYFEEQPPTDVSSTFKHFANQVNQSELVTKWAKSELKQKRNMWIDIITQYYKELETPALEMAHKDLCDRRYDVDAYLDNKQYMI